MKIKLLICLLCCVFLMGCTAAPEVVLETTEAPSVTVEPTTEATTEPVTEPTQPEPEPVEYVLSFVGD